MNFFFQPVRSVVSIKDTTEKALLRLGIKNIRDLLFYRPYSCNIYQFFPKIKDIQNNSLVQLEVFIDEIEIGKWKSPTKILVSDSSGVVLLVFFNKIPPFIFARLRIGQKFIVRGKAQLFDGIFQITHPEFVFKKSLVVDVEPIYHLTYGLTNRQLFDYVTSAIKSLDLATQARVSFANISDEEKKYLLALVDEIKLLHLVGQKANRVEIEQAFDDARKLLATRELFVNQLMLAKLKLRTQENAILGRSFKIDNKIKQEVVAKLGFSLTRDQLKVIDEIESDQSKNIQMMRLLQGDVGSGKTIVALLTMLNVVKSGAQSVLMAPTDLLSTQHFQFFIKSLKETAIKVELLTGQTKAKDKKDTKEKLLSGEIDILIGTHALFQDTVEFKNLGYVIIDEQHRFGVEQRVALINKATHPDVLVMTATPIPRSLTLTMFGDMSVSQIKSKPSDRLPIKTTVLSTGKRDEVADSLAKIINNGQKIYWICPLIDQNDKTIEKEEGVNYADATNRLAHLSKLYPNQVGIVHGKMKAHEKDAIMQQFKDNELAILVATTVIEVGIDVPLATLIIIENAEKFGLAQLHQLRGRVGRGNLQSYCMLMYNPRLFSKDARKRLEIMKESDDGFYISEQDLILRGGGEILGIKQSGEPTFYFADLAKDLDILIKVNKDISHAAGLNDEFTSFITALFDKDKEPYTKSG